MIISRNNQPYILNQQEQLESNDDYKIVKYAWMLIAVTAFLLLFGLVMLYSTSYGVVGTKYFQRQIVWAIIGTSSGTLCYYIGYKKLCEYSGFLLFFSWILLLLALLGPEIKGANRWIHIPLPGLRLSLQPSELVKVILALFVAEYCSKYFRTFPYLKEKYGLLRIGAISAIMMGTVLAGKDYGTTALIGVMVLFIMLSAGMPLRYTLIAVCLIFIAGFYFYFFDEVRWSRIITFYQPELYKEKGGYQLWMSLLALGSGGWTGQGFMQSRLKAKYLPEAHTDFILSIVGEELGYLTMVLFIFSLYFIFSYCALKITLSSSNKKGMFVGFGITTFITVQALINVSVIAGLVPTKGMPAPFISYGGSNLLACLTAVGILLSVAAERVTPNYNENFWNIITKIMQKFKRSKLVK